jgi:hypothetical protein
MGSGFLCLRMGRQVIKTSRIVQPTVQSEDRQPGFRSPCPDGKTQIRDVDLDLFWSCIHGFTTYQF